MGEVNCRDVAVPKRAMGTVAHVLAEPRVLPKNVFYKSDPSLNCFYISYLFSLTTSLLSSNERL